MLFGGNFDNGANCGAFYVNVNNRLGNARFNNGSLGMFKDNGHIQPYHLVKIFLRKQLVG